MQGEAPTANEWALIATLHHRPGRRTRVRLARAGERIDTEGWSRSEGWCEHCRTRRARRTTYLLRHVDGPLAQVGSSCLAEFIGHPNPMRVLRPTHRMRSSSSAHPPAPARGDRPVDYVDTVAYVAHVAQVVLDGGFVSTRAATRQKPATWSQAAAALDRGHPPGGRAERRARQALVWAREDLAQREGLAEFERRLVLVVGQNRLTRRELPTAAAVIYAYHQELRRRIAARQKKGEHIGTPSQPVAASLSVRRVERVATERGPVYRHFLSDELGRNAIWDAQDAQLSAGTHRLRATVAAHREANGRPVTILERCLQIE